MGTLLVEGVLVSAVAPAVAPVVNDKLDVVPVLPEEEGDPVATSNTLLLNRRLLVLCVLAVETLGKE